ncbi:MAG TPA: CoA pyrophosphatase [Candidatus Binatia bacterium]|nr:CoA pyrophosphatase [Candidatus Binatia bacterium]
MIAIFADEPHGVVFVKRAGHLRRNPGQIGLPGGMTDPIDGADPATTAVRELYEELGVRPTAIRVVGQLEQQRQVSGGVAVTPVVGVLEPRTPLHVDRTETIGAFTVPLAAIVAPGKIYEDPALGTGDRTLYALDHEGRHIWGLTARILKVFADEWNARSALRQRIEAALQGGGKK